MAGFAAYLARYGHVTSTAQQRVLRALTLCRTAALGGHTTACDHCGHLESSYNSCRNRHCPKCQGSAQAAWLADRQREVLNVPYFHVVFTLTVCLDATSLVVRSYGCDDGRIEPTRCAVIGTGRGDR